MFDFIGVIAKMWWFPNRDYYRQRPKMVILAGAADSEVGGLGEKIDKYKDIVMYMWDIPYTDVGCPKYVYF
jgi:hypothetical protein